MSADSITPASANNAIGTALLARCGVNLPRGAWQVAAASAGVAGADAFLCHRSRSITGALERLAASFEAARANIGAVRDSAAIGAQLHCDDLESRVESAEASKRVALERELLVVDAALERLRAERSTVSDAIAHLSDSELEARHAELTARLDAADSQLLALPTSVIEPPYVGIVIDEAALLAGAAVFGRVVAPRAITAADLTLEGPPSLAYPGCTLMLRLAIQGAHHVTQSAEELEVSLGSVAAASHIEAHLDAVGAAPQPLQADVSADIVGRCLNITIIVPLDAPVGSLVCFGPLAVSWQLVPGLLGPLVVKPACPADLSSEHAAWLQSNLPSGGSPSPGAWQEVYRATTHGFGAAAFHERCDMRTRLLVLVRAREGGWLFGGFTAVGFSPPERYIADPSAFLFSLTNSLGRPEKLESTGSGQDLYYHHSVSATFGSFPFADLAICDSADTVAGSATLTGNTFAASASTADHPMAQEYYDDWLAAEVVAWVV